MTRLDDLTTPFDAYLRDLRPVTDTARAEAAEHRARLVYLERAQRDALIAQEDAAQDRGMEGRVNPLTSDVSIVSGDKTST